MPTLHLTDLSVRALKAAEATAYYWDTTTPAFGIRVGKRAKTWTVVRGRNRERVTIGRYPAMKLSDARTQAKRLLAAEQEDKGVRIASAARELLNKSENERSGVLSTAMSFLGLYRDPVVARVTDRCDWQISDLVDEARPASLYLVVPPSDISRTKPLTQ